MAFLELQQPALEPVEQRNPSDRTEPWTLAFFHTPPLDILSFVGRIVVHESAVHLLRLVWVT